MDAGQPRFITILIIIIIIISVIISVIMILTRFITSESSSNVSVSTGTRANLHCTIENAHRRTVGWGQQSDTWCSSHFPRQVSWVTLRNLSSPGLLAVGQFVFTTDQRVSVTRAPALRRWTLSITVTLSTEDLKNTIICHSISKISIHHHRQSTFS